MFRAALRAPPRDGLNVMVIVQFAPILKLEPQVVPDSEKSPAFAPVTVMVLTSKGAVPVFDSVTTCPALVRLTCCMLKVSDAGDTPATGIVPVPVSETARSGCAGSLFAIMSDALRPSSAVGVNVMLIIQLPLAATLAPQVFPEMAKSPAFAPVIVMPLTSRGAVPVFVRVTDWAALVVFLNWSP